MNKSTGMLFLGFVLGAVAYKVIDRTVRNPKVQYKLTEWCEAVGDWICDKVEDILDEAGEEIDLSDIDL